MKCRKIVSLLLAVVIALLAAVPAFAAPDDTVGEISICSDGKSTHIWIYIHNTSDETIRVGLYDVPPGEGVSLGSFGITCYDGAGTYYNLEAHRNIKLTNSTCVSITEDLSRSELEKVTARLLSFNHWDIFVNCSYFACGVWNSVSDTRVVACPIWYFCRLQILLIAGRGTTCPMPNAPGEKVFHQVGTGSGAYLEQASQKTLDVK